PPLPPPPGSCPGPALRPRTRVLRVHPASEPDRGTDRGGGGCAVFADRDLASPRAGVTSDRGAGGTGRGAGTGSGRTRGGGETGGLTRAAPGEPVGNSVS